MFFFASNLMWQQHKHDPRVGYHVNGEDELDEDWEDFEYGSEMNSLGDVVVVLVHAEFHFFIFERLQLFLVNKVVNNCFILLESYVL